jgi:hypothetical protein
MTLTPEISMYIRDTYKYTAALLVAVGALSAKGAIIAGSLTDLVVPLLTSLLGLGLAIYATVKARNAKKATSVEAQIIAGRVEVNPNTKPILPAGPLDDKAKDAHL